MNVLAWSVRWKPLIFLAANNLRCDFNLKSFYSTRKSNLYEVLGLNRTASDKEIKAAYFRLSKQCHPDSNPTNPALHDRFVEINEAYTTLSKPSKRAEYDTQFGPDPRPSGHTFTSTKSTRTGSSNPWQSPRSSGDPRTYRTFYDGEYVEYNSGDDDFDSEEAFYCYDSAEKPGTSSGRKRNKNAAKSSSRSWRAMDEDHLDEMYFRVLFELSQTSKGRALLRQFTKQMDKPPQATRRSKSYYYCADERDSDFDLDDDLFEDDFDGYQDYSSSRRRRY